MTAPVLAPVLTSVLGPVDPGGLGTVLAAETLLRAPGPTPKPAGAPASEVEFERSLVRMPMLGRLIMGAPNRDDRTLSPADAEQALREFAGAGGAAVVALAGRGSAATPAELARLAAASGTAIVRGAAAPGARPAGEAAGDPEAAIAAVLAELDAAEHPAGVVGAVPGARDGDPASGEAIRLAAAAARRAGAALVLEAGPDLATVERSLAAVDAAGLARDRVMLVGLIAAGTGTGTGTPAGAGGVLAGRVGVAPGRLEALLELGTAVCFDDLGRIPTVRTAVTDFEAALAVLRCAELGAAERVTLSCGIAAKHRLTAFGGNGLEFVGEQFLPLLSRLGADDALVAAVGGGNAARILARVPGPESGRKARSAPRAQTRENGGTA
jgi:phosphotriesterase-related protein